MDQLSTEEKLTELKKYFDEISNTPVRGTSIFHFVGTQILDNLKACIGQSDCGECNCCTHFKNALLDEHTKIQAKLAQPTEHKLNQVLDILDQIFSSLAKETSLILYQPINDPEKQKATEPNTPIPGVSGLQKPKAKKLKFDPKETPKNQTTVRANKRKSTGDKNDTRKLLKRSCKKNISYSPKIPHGSQHKKKLSQTMLKD